LGRKRFCRSYSIAYSTKKFRVEASVIQTRKIAVVGVGARGLTVLERITAIYNRKLNGYELDVHLIDPEMNGQGVHSSSQRQHLLTNTVPCQITLFGDHTVVEAGPPQNGPTFLEWARAQNYRKIAYGQYCKVGEGLDTGAVIEENEYLPRALLGEYLTWVYEYLISHLPAGVHVYRHKEMVSKLCRVNNNLFKLTLTSGQCLVVDCAVLTTGHGQNTMDPIEMEYLKFVNDNKDSNLHLQYLRAYPLKQLKQIDKDAVVAIQGMGLSALDVLAELTCGRGGKFIEKEKGEVSYLPSGFEPKIYVFSRSGLPLSARGNNQKGIGGKYTPRFFTRSNINRLIENARMKRGSPQLEFEQELMPILIREMCYVYESTLNGEWSEADKFEASEETGTIIRHLFNPLATTDEFNDMNSFTNWIIDFVKDDLKHADQGNVSSPVKAATDLIRDVRDNLRYVIDNRGLTPESHKYLLENFVPTMNRIAVGPPKEKNQELLALIRAGIVHLACVSNPQVICGKTTASFMIQSKDMNHQICADVLIKAMVEPFYPERDDSLLMKNMLEDRLIRPFRNGNFHPGGIDIGKHHNVIDGDGEPVQNLWALGNIVEGANFYTFVLPRPLANSQAVQDAGKCVLNMLSLLDEPRRR
ncbi:unnamed protein product, partial [Didymodactylos carnosus]